MPGFTKHLLVAIVLFGLAPTAFGQKLLKVDVQQITFLRASAAQILPQDDGVAILAEDLADTREFAAKIVITDQPNEYIEASRLLNVDGITVAEFPPLVITPISEGEDTNTYLLSGNPGDRFGVSIRSGGVVPQWLEVKIDGPVPDPDKPDPDQPAPDQPEPDKPDPVDPPAGDLTPADLTKIENTVSSAVVSLADPITQAEIKSELEALVANFPAERAAAVAETQNAIARGLVKSAPKLKPPYKDWKGKFRTPLDAAIVSMEAKANTAAEFKQIVAAIVKGLATPVQAAAQASQPKRVKKIFYRDATKQVPRYCSAGKICGWDTVTVKEAYWGWVTED